MGARLAQPPTAGSCTKVSATKVSGRPVLAPAISPPIM
jgi:hypothetical protein